MNKITLEEVWELAEQLPQEDREELVKRLRIQKRPPLNLPVIDVGPWPDELSLRREDWYDDER